MPERWTAEQVIARAPDPSAVAAGRRLAVPGPWSSTGAGGEPPALWGLCRGSGSQPYRAAVELTGPAFSCSCPSRRSPCKHALGLLLLWASGAVADVAVPPGWVTGWIAARAGQARRARPRAGATPPAPDAALRRAEQRRSRMTSGLAELEQWLCDQARSGLAGAERAGYQPFDTLAARLVDAQLPAVAAAVRRLTTVAVSGEGWPGRLLQEYGLLHLLARAAPPTWENADGEFAATVRAHLGVNVAKDDVLARPAVPDRWVVLGARDDLEERLTVRRVWLHGERTSRTALVLSFAVPGQPLDTSLVPGHVVDADLHFYPGSVPLRALVGARRASSGAVPAVRGTGLAAALAGWADALRRDPWLRAWPVVLTGVVPVVEAVEGSSGERWWLVDGAGSIPVVGAGEHTWSLLAASGGHPVPVLAEIVPGGARVVGPIDAPVATGSGTAVPA